MRVDCVLIACACVFYIHWRPALPCTVFTPQQLTVASTAVAPTKFEQSQLKNTLFIYVVSFYLIFLVLTYLYYLYYSCCGPHMNYDTRVTLLGLCVSSLRTANPRLVSFRSTQSFSTGPLVPWPVGPLAHWSMYSRWPPSAPCCGPLVP